MNRLPIVVLLVVVSLSCAQNDSAPAPAETQAPQAALHAAPGVDHKMLRPDTITWQDGPPSLPPGAKFALLEGDPAKPGFFAMRLRLPDGYRIPPHYHPGVERVTVLSGTFHLGHGETFDPAAAEVLPAGSYSSMQPGMRHFAFAKGETVVQVATMGPWGITYVNPADDPRRK